MPLFDYRCSVCGHVEERLVRQSEVDQVIGCSNTWDRDFACEGVMHKMPCVPNMHIFPKDGIHLSNVSAEGKTFYSKNEMKKYARENNLELGALL